ncbi:MAG TPA: T9SS type A sorting domain-containing protein [Bacteroidales bacterium]|nr:T9SS type A sorting domain-containing protein [Bacteroidales bacterium]
MKNIIRTALIITVFSVFSLSKTFAQLWPKTYQGSYDNVYAIDLKEAYDNSYLLLSICSESYTYYDHIWVTKTDINGNILWDKKIGNTSYGLQCNAFRQTQDGGLIIASSRQNSGANDWDYDPCIIKMNACGEIEWAKWFPVEGTINLGYDVVQTPEGNYDFMVLMYTYDAFSDQRISIIRLDPEGNVIATKDFIRDDPKIINDEANSLLLLDNGTALITGYADYPNPEDSVWYYSRSYFINYDHNLTANWNIVWGINDHHYSIASRSAESNNGMIYSAGRHTRNEVPGYPDSPCLFKLSICGEPLMAKDLIENTQLGIATTIDFLNDTTLILSTGWTINDQPQEGVLVIDTLGNVLKQKPLISDYYTFCGSSVTYDKKYLCFGSFLIGEDFIPYLFKLTPDLEDDTLNPAVFTYDSLCGHPIISSVIDPQWDIIVGIDEPEKNLEAQQFLLSPNPATDNVTITLPQYTVEKTKTGGFTVVTTTYRYNDKPELEIYDLNGRLQLSRTLQKDEKELTLNISSLPAGVYMVRLVADKKQVAETKLVVVK